MTDFYELLGVSPMASQKEIKAAYKRLASECHPDKHPQEFKEEFGKKMAAINEAYATLSDAKKRRWYDADRERGQAFNQSASSAWESFKAKARPKQAKPKQPKEPKQPKPKAPPTGRVGGGLCPTCAGHGVIRVAVQFTSQNIACPRC